MSNIEGWGKTVFRVDLPQPAEPIFIAADRYEAGRDGLTFSVETMTYTTFAPGAWVRVTLLGPTDVFDDGIA